ncbi:Leucoanthocyanidin dioxygenase [Acorus calamus]|uniref:Leucoanthocyanidin dioxygenase n=1 Tax=Acorus calamus TaxID=4465 RepID=A0AAV9CSE6_ACOCL|nr:Leucoanthocyanidin dioxygenase [Acorus calamus]
MQQRVQELAMDGQDPPVTFIQREPDRHIVVLSPRSPIPTVDLGLVFESDGGEIGKLKSALQSWGLFQAIGHGIPNSVLDEVRNITREFFKLPVEEKQRYSNAIEGGKEPGLEGYGNDRVASEDQILDWSDRLYLLVEPENERKPNFWPEKPSSFS